MNNGAIFQDIQSIIEMLTLILSGLKSSYFYEQQ
jgi:hypothetical protein